jgi:hypothetical protein
MPALRIYTDSHYVAKLMKLHLKNISKKIARHNTSAYKFVTLLDCDWGCVYGSTSLEGNLALFNYFVTKSCI